jgi:hypothetical protein
MNRNVCQNCGGVWSDNHQCVHFVTASPPDRPRTKHDPVHRPAHYNQGGVECIDAIRAQLTEDEWRGYLRGQVAKYNWRLGAKDDPKQEAGKLLFYARLLAGEDPRGK